MSPANQSARGSRGFRPGNKMARGAGYYVHGAPEIRKHSGSSGPNCPACGYQKSAVIDSRHGAGERHRRRRVCGACGTRFTTAETVVSEASA